LIAFVQRREHDERLDDQSFVLAHRHVREGGASPDPSYLDAQAHDSRFAGSYVIGRHGARVQVRRPLGTRRGERRTGDDRL